MGRPAQLKVDIVADARKVKDGVADANSGFGRLGEGAKRLGTAVGVGLGAAVAAAGAFAVSSIGAASDVQQSFGALESVYGKNAVAVKKWANEAAVAVGLSKNEYANLAAVVGAQLQGMGVSQAASAKQSRDLIKVGADLSATFGGSVSDAVEAVSSLLKGESDPIERYGVSIKQSDVNARLAAQGLGKLTGSALKQAQAQATLSLLMEKTKTSVGAFGRESDTLAHRQQVLQAKFENIKATVGQALLPVLTALAGFAADTLLPALSKLGPLMDAIKTAFQVFFDALTGRSELNEFDGSLRNVNNAGIAVGSFIRDTLLPAFQSFMTVIRDQVLPPVLTFYRELAAHLIPVIGTLGRFFSSVLLPAVGKVATFVAQYVVPTFSKLLKPALDGIRSLVQKVTDKLLEHKDSFQKLWDLLKPFMAFLRDKVAPLLGGALKVAFETIGTAIGLVVDGVSLLIDGISGAISKIKELVNYIKNSKVGQVIGGVSGAIGKVGGALGHIGLLRVAPAGSVTTISTSAVQVLTTVDPVGTARQLARSGRNQAVRSGTYRKALFGVPVIT